MGFDVVANDGFEEMLQGYPQLMHLPFVSFSAFRKSGIQQVVKQLKIDYYDLLSEIVNDHENESTVIYTEDDKVLIGDRANERLHREMFEEPEDLKPA